MQATGVQNRPRWLLLRHVFVWWYEPHTHWWPKTQTDVAQESCMEQEPGTTAVGDFSPLGARCLSSKQQETPVQQAWLKQPR